ncbi:MAG: DNA cytosine methyltransferase [Frankiaceae bacterium]
MSPLSLTCLGKEQVGRRATARFHDHDFGRVARAPATCGRWHSPVLTIAASLPPMPRNVGAAWHGHGCAPAGRASDYMTASQGGHVRIAGLFAGIGGIEQGFRAALGTEAIETALLCENWAPAARVLRSRFEAERWHDDIDTLPRIPPKLDVVAAGFPCTDLSQAGRTAGIAGSQSGLVFTLLTLVEAAVRRRQARDGC